MILTRQQKTFFLYHSQIYNKLLLVLKQLSILNFSKISSQGDYRLQDVQQQATSFIANEINTSSKHHNMSKFIEQAAAASGVPMTSSSAMPTSSASQNLLSSPTLNFGASPTVMSSTFNQNYRASQLPLPKDAVPCTQVAPSQAPAVQIPSVAVQTQLVEQHNGYSAFEAIIS